MTARSERVYPVRVLSRDLHLHRLAIAALESTNRPDLGSVCAVLRMLRHRVACAERWEETRSKRLTEYELRETTEALRDAVRFAICQWDAEQARALARSLVRLTRV